MIHFIRNGMLGMMLAWSLQCQADSISNLDTISSAPKISGPLVSGACSNLYVSKLPGVEAMVQFLGPNRSISIVAHPDAWHSENAECFLVTGTSFAKPAACDETVPIAAYFWGLIRGSLNAQRLDEKELFRRRMILLQIVSEEEPELVKGSDRESLSNLFNLLIPPPMNFSSFDPKYLCRIEDQIAANPRIRERILKAIGVATTNSAAGVHPRKD